MILDVKINLTFCKIIEETKILIPLYASLNIGRKI
jgi:hypothetical protein